MRLARLNARLRRSSSAGAITSPAFLFPILVCTSGAATFLLAAPPLLPLAFDPTSEASVTPVWPVSHVDVEALLALEASTGYTDICHHQHPRLSVVISCSSKSAGTNVVDRTFTREMCLYHGYALDEVLHLEPSLP